ncbi:hypothetical protein [Gracilibacillus phocaeensis]|uniref:hypothetical protein n=1 Tax=Gracilibacillus phocaeensis TaxID=2042304 RepID=UPI00102F3023|nr:hypothetical protein [Gracilibacillus phocaeensis]
MNNKFRMPLLIALIAMMVLDMSGVIRVPAIVIILLIVGLLAYNISIRQRGAKPQQRNKKK